MKFKGLKKLCWISSIILLSLIASSCANIPVPDVPVCKELSPSEGYCSYTVSNKSMFVNDENKYEDKTYWQHRPYMIQMFPSSYEQFKATMTKICTKFQQDCQANDVDGMIKRMDEVVAYQKPPVENTPPISTPVQPPATIPEPPKPYPPSGWDSRYDDLIKSEMLKGNLLKVQPSRMNFCPKWESLKVDQRMQEFAFYLRGITVFESSTTLNSRYVETTMGIDPITGMQVASEGLFQLSYQDAKNYEGCKEIDFKKDKGLDSKDLKRTIFNPEIQIKCTVYIMNRIMEKRTTENAIGEGSYGLGRYWSVVRTNKKAGNISEKMKSYGSNCFQK